jgi:transposase
MLKPFQYRLYPTKQQQRLLSRQVDERRWRWNTLLAARKRAGEERKRAGEERQDMVDYYEQKAERPSLKAGERPTLTDVHSPVLPDVALRLKKAFDAFF